MNKAGSLYNFVLRSIPGEASKVATQQIFGSHFSENSPIKMKFIHFILRPIPRITIIFLSHFIRFCPRYGDLQKHTHEENRE